MEPTTERIGLLLTLRKDKLQIALQTVRMMSKLVDTSKRQVRQAKNISIADGQDDDLDSTDPLKQTVNQVLPSEEAQKAKWAQHLASFKPKQAKLAQSSIKG